MKIYKKYKINELKPIRPECFGKSTKLSVECCNCNYKERCIDYINARSSGTFFIPTNKPYPPPPRIKHSIKTNADKIRNMDDEELAEWLDEISNQDREGYEGIGCYNCMYYGTHHYPGDCGDCEWKNGILAWLKSESK